MALTLRVVNVNNNIGFHSSFSRSTFVSPNPSKSSSREYNSFVFQCSQVEQLSVTESENSLIEALIGIQGRGRSTSPQQLNSIERAIQVLESLGGGVPDPTNSSLIEGRWQLIFTTRPGTASPIQRTFVGVDFFSVFQEVYLRTNDPRVSNIVSFSDAIGELKVEAAASIGDGKRILFRFDRAAFSFKFLPFKVPYPVPFKLLGDEAKGWLDTTYLSHSGNLRISRGNKGTTFVLQKQTEPKQKLLTAISSGVGVREEIDKLISLNKNSGEEPELEEGEWQMIWNSQTVTDSWLENAANGLMGKQIVGKNGGIKYVVDILLGLKFSMTGTFVKSAPKVYEVTMDDAAIIGGPFGYPLEFGKKFILEILFSDNKVRISRGDNGIIFVHSRTNALR
ncbi:putative plastid-lipid-associated protein chloroplastic-like [Trifolium pratense]|uniref:Putative plastid-lipid-associated protein chloroplastic-like n=1 Tax=Trifolium pratense TaxID=57577 RepID=A0A2K3NZX9_TRIPR|nr:probable plastid-lipid-associated protein 12, chloroplastic isoform X1 [Trifolium pratense]PNY08588.1 putative plastid-lipid-associated protein chloroplastic-like [Trifolium pratense]